MAASSYPFASSSFELVEKRPSRSVMLEFSTPGLDFARPSLEPNGFGAEGAR